MSNVTLSKDRNWAASGTAVFHGLLILLIVILMRDCGTAPGGGGGGGGGNNSLLPVDLAGIPDLPTQTEEVVQTEPETVVSDDMSAITDDVTSEPAPTANNNTETPVKPKDPKPKDPKPQPKPQISNPLNDALGQLDKPGSNPNPPGPGTGPGSGPGTGPGTGPGSGPGSGGGPGGNGFGFEHGLAGRTWKVKPSLDEKPTEEGVVTVNVIVNQDGTIDPNNITINVDGTNTTSSKLRQLAIKAAKSARFNASDKPGKQSGTIKITFKLK